MLKSRVGKQLHWSFMWLKESESFCGKSFVLKESAQYSSSILATTLFAISRKKIWVNGRTFFLQQFHHFVSFASIFEKTCDESFDDISSNNLCQSCKTKNAFASNVFLASWLGFLLKVLLVANFPAAGLKQGSYSATEGRFFFQGPFYVFFDFWRLVRRMIMIFLPA